MHAGQEDQVADASADMHGRATLGVWKAILTKLQSLYQGRDRNGISTHPGTQTGSSQVTCACSASADTPE